MQAAQTSVRAVLVACLLYLQFHLLTTNGILNGIPSALSHQVGIQILVMLVAPAGFRIYATTLAAWVSALLGIVIGLAWVTVVVPLILLKGAVLHDESQILLQFLGLTAYLSVPVAIIVFAYMMDEAWD